MIYANYDEYEKKQIEKLMTSLTKEKSFTLSIWSS